MYGLDCKTFRQLLENTPEETTEDDFEEVVPYLVEKVGFPLLHGQPLAPNQIDYSRFTLDDLYDLLDAAKEHCNRRYRLWEMNRNLCGQTAPPTFRRAFC